MIDYLLKNFPQNYNYLVEQAEQDIIDNFFVEHFFKPTQEVRKHNLLGDFARKLSLTGQRIGWVPNHFQLTFFSETVEQEIANALVMKQNKIKGGEREVEISRLLLDKIGILNIAERNPFFLSEGETKLVWFLTQWAKSPEYLVIGYLPSGMSQQNIDQLLNFILNSDKLLGSLNLHSPVFILGYSQSENLWYNTLISDTHWKKIEGFQFSL